jgi:branched-chain amino acid transport system permease protein
VTTLVQSVFDTIGIIGPLALAALGFALIYRVSGHLHFAYFGLWTLSATLIGDRVEHGWGLAVSTAVAALTSSVLAVGCYALYKRLRGQYTVVLTAFGLFTILVATTQLIWGGAPKGYDVDRAFSGVWTIHVGDDATSLTQAHTLALVIAAGVALALAWFFGRTHTGLFVRAVAEDPMIADMTGLRTTSLVAMTYVAGTVIGTVSASLEVVAVGSSLDSGTNLALEVLAVTILAGAAVVGTLAAALLFSLLLVAADLAAGPRYITLIGYGALFVVLRIAKNGLFSRDFIWPPARRTVQSGTAVAAAPVTADSSAT